MTLCPEQLPVTDLDAAAAFLRDSDDLMVTSHVNSDGDGIGGCLALAGLLRGMGKQVGVVLQDVPDDTFAFLAGFADIAEAVEPAPRTYDRVVILDCPGAERIGTAGGYIADGSRLLNLDHHTDNQRFADVNVVTDGVCSTCELIYHLAAHMDLLIDADMAAQLYTGIIYDTGTFRYSLTTPTSLEVGADLVRRGARLDDIADHIYNNASFGSVKLIGRAIESMELHCDDRLALLHLTNHDMQLGDPEAAANYGLMVRGVEVTALLKEEEPGQFRISLRSRENVNVSTLAHTFGGGGHERAAGCRLQGSLDEVKRRLHQAVTEMLR